MIHQPPAGTPIQWAALSYLAVVSMFLGFFAWYRGLAIGPMAQGQSGSTGPARAQHHLGSTAAR